MTAALVPGAPLVRPTEPGGALQMTEPQTSDWWPYERRNLYREQLVVERYDGTDGYQRYYRQRFVDGAVREFKPSRYNALIVARIVGGRHYEPERELFAVIDGQHRYGMAEALGLDPVPCDVYRRHMDYQERALEFHALNRDKQMLNVADGARALYEGQDEELLGLLYLLERHSFYLHGFRPAHVNGHRALHATHTLQTAYAMDARALGDALNVLEPWQSIINRRHERLVLNALMLWCRRDGIDLDRLRGVLVRYGPDHLVREAAEVAARVGRANPNPTHLANAMLQLYNGGLRSRRIDEPF